MIKPYRLRLLFAGSLWLLGGLLATPWEMLSVESLTVAPREVETPDTPQFSAIEFLYRFITIFINNLVVAGFLGIGGFFTAGFLPIVGTIYNGYLLGAICRAAIASGVSLKLITAALIFHGPLELFALSLSAAVGLQGFDMMRDWTESGEFSASHFPSRSVICVILALLVIASFIESAVINLLL